MILFLLALNTAIGFAAEPSPTPDARFEKSMTRKILGTDFGGSQSIGLDSAAHRVEAKASARILGRSVNYLQADLDAQIPGGPPPVAEFYAFGKRVWSEAGYVENQGFLKGAIGLAPVEVRVPAVAYPVGPLVLEVDAGARAQARLSAQLVPTIFIPAENSSVAAVLHADATLTGFIEGYAKLLVLRGGVGGELVLVDGSADLTAQLWFNGTPAEAQLSAQARFLDGRFFAFADYFNVFGWKWRRFLEKNLFSWNGYCFSTGTGSCAAP